jgi:hypothetical protein
MIYDWYKIFNLDEFIATGLRSRTYTLELEEIGQKDILVTRANLYSILYDGIFLPISLNDKNPFEFEGHAVYLDSNNDVFLGIAVDET